MKFLFVVFFLTSSFFTFLVSPQAQTLTLYCEFDPPLQYKDKDGNLTGFTVEVVRQIQKIVDNDDPVLLVPWARGYAAVQKTPNVALFSMTRTRDREHLFQWVGPIKESVYALYSRADSPIVLKNLEEAKHLKAIGVYLDDIRDQFLTAHGFKNLERVADNVANVRKVMLGRLDAFAGGRFGLAKLTVDAGYKPEDFKELLEIMKVQVYVAFSIGTPGTTVAAWNRALESMREDGSFGALYRKYYPVDPLPSAIAAPPAY